MSNPTSNFGWVMPTSTDLVTDLPADFAVFGQGVDTTMADLKGGTSGQILSKASNTDMDFTWIANDQGDITAVNVTSPITGGGSAGAVTVGIQDASTSQKGSVQLSDSTSTTSSVLAATPTAVKSSYDLAAAAIPKSLLDAKGDIVSATADNTPSVVTVGANGTQLVADSTATSGLRWQATPSASNPILNSAFQLWQRGTSISVAASSTGYTADRWYTVTGANQACTISRQATGDTTNLPNIQYCMRFQRNSGQTGTGQLTIGQSFESVNAIPFAGKTVILSFYARAGANYSPTSSAFLPIIFTGTGTDQNALSGYTGNVTNYTSVTLTTTWQRFTYSITVPTTATEIAPAFGINPTGTAGTNDYYEVTGVQIDIGSVALPFRTYAATIQAELAACQRYYYQIATGTSVPISLVYYDSASLIRGLYQMPVTMRTASPTLVQTTGTNYYSTQDGDGFNSLTLYNASASTLAWYNNTEVSGTSSRPQGINTNNASASLGISAEL